MQGVQRGGRRRITVVIVDDSVLLLETLEAALDGHPDVEVVGTAVDGTRALVAVEEQRPDAVLLDLRLGQSWGLDLVPDLRVGPRPPAVVVYSASTDQLTRDAAVRAGAQAQVVKGAPVGEIAAVLVAAVAADGSGGAQS